MNDSRRRGSNHNSANPSNSALINQNRPFTYEMNNQEMPTSNLGPGASGLAVPPKSASLAQKVLVKNQNASGFGDNDTQRFESLGFSGSRTAGGYGGEDQQQTFKPPKPATLPKPILVRPTNQQADRYSPVGYDSRFQSSQAQPQQIHQTVHTTRFDRTPIQAPAVRVCAA